MIVCANCGEQNAEDTAFCGACGAFLEWEGTAADAPPPEADADTVTDARKAAGVSAEVVTGPAGPRLPGEEERRRAPRRPPPPPRPVAPGELVCAKCGAGNDPVRRFCRSCGTPLRPADAVARPGWWRRMWTWLTGRRTFEAGQRRRLRKQVRVPRKFIALALVVVLGGTVAGPARPLVKRAQTEIKDRTAAHVPITPTALRASSSRGGAAPERLADRAANKYWAPAGDPKGAWVEAQFPRPMRLLDVVITGGQATDAEQFQRQGRPHEVEVVATAQNGKTTRIVLQVRDQAGAQKFSVKGDNIVKVRLTFRSAYGMAAGRFMAVGEVEFFGRT